METPRDPLVGTGQPVSLVAGGASGIGRAVVARLLRGGHRVVVADLDLAAAEAVAGELGAGPDGADLVRALPYDAAVPTDVAAVVADARACFGRLDGAVVAAGVIGRAAADPFDFEPEGWSRVLEVNVLGAYGLLVGAARAMAGDGGGALVAVTSLAAHQPAMASSPAYVASKAALAALVSHLAPRLAPLGVRINGVAPGITRTAMSRVLDDDPARREAALAGVPLGRMAEPEEIADAVAFLLGTDSSFITGEHLVVAGGALHG